MVGMGSSFESNGRCPTSDFSVSDFSFSSFKSVALFGSTKRSSVSFLISALIGVPLSPDRPIPSHKSSSARGESGWMYASGSFLVLKNVSTYQQQSFKTPFENQKPDGHSMTSKSWYTTLTFIPSDFVAILFVNSLNKPLSLRFRFRLWSSKSINEDLPKDGASIIRWEFWKFLALIPEFNYLFWFAKIRRLPYQYLKNHSSASFIVSKFENLI